VVRYFPEVGRCFEARLDDLSRIVKGLDAPSLRKLTYELPDYVEICNPPTDTKKSMQASTKEHPLP
jgi:hypothetical protein